MTRSGRGPVAVVLIDLDRFKEINDRRGHECGDRTLQEVAVLVSRLTGDRGLVARLGGDELGVLLPSSSLEEAPRLAELARQEARALHVPGGAAHEVSLSLGVTCAARDIAVPQVVMRSADEQLYRAKHTRDAVCAGRPLAPVPAPRQASAGTADLIGPTAEHTGARPSTSS
jgi:diguanylate cyclase (GGDEF)-like protein